jgi:PleD family two-component response regulator
MAGKRICLLIDDDADDQHFFSVVLKQVSENVDLIVAKDAQTAMQILRQDPSPDYIFLDLNLPGIDGYEFLLHLKRDIKHRKIPVIVYSAIDDETQIAKTKKLGAADFFTKTYKLYELEALLRKYIKD